MDKPYEKPDKEFIRRTFDSISPRYDLLNQILSFGSADQWRKLAAIYLMSDLPMSADSILDVGVGTGDFLKWFLRRREQQVPASVPGAQGTGLKGSWESAMGVDFSVAMLQKARKKISGSVMWLQEDFDSLPFLEASFDLVISGFTLRSVQKLQEFLGRVHRILTPGGRAAFLDLTRPRNSLARLLFYLYLKFVLPLLGWLISGNLKAYGFLSGSVRKFQAPEETIRLMQAAGYRNCTSKSFAFGAATLIIGQK